MKELSKPGREIFVSVDTIDAFNRCVDALETGIYLLFDDNRGWAELLRPHVDSLRAVHAAINGNYEAKGGGAE